MQAAKKDGKPELKLREASEWTGKKGFEYHKKHEDEDEDDESDEEEEEVSKLAQVQLAFIFGEHTWTFVASLI